MSFDTHPGHIQRTFVLDPPVAAEVLGVADQNLSALEDSVGCDVFVRGNSVVVTGPPTAVSRALDVLGELQKLAHKKVAISPESVSRAVTMAGAKAPESVAQILSHAIVSSKGKTVRPKTFGQKKYVDAIDDNTIIFGLGPAGTGKTYLAVAKAVQALKERQVNRIILTRPAVEAGEKLGFLPGTLDQKIDPYLRPLYDALRDMLDPEAIPKLMESGVIEVAPLAYMRGRTLNDAFIILDEAQNTTAAQMKMFLTRLGFGSKMVVTGDSTQTDLPGGQTSGLNVVRRILKGVDGIVFSELGRDDVVRHQIVADIVDAYAAWEEKNSPRPRHP